MRDVRRSGVCPGLSLPIYSNGSGLLKMKGKECKMQFSSSATPLVWCEPTPPAPVGTTVASERATTASSSTTTTTIHARQIGALRGHLFDIEVSKSHFRIEGKDISKAYLEVATTEYTFIQNQSLGHKAGLSKFHISVAIRKESRVSSYLQISCSGCD